MRISKYNLFVSVLTPGGAQDFLTPGSIFFSNPSRKFDVTSGPKNQDFLLRTAEKRLM